MLLCWVTCPFTWNIFFQCFTFNLGRYFVLRWVPCRQHMCEIMFLIHSATLCLLIGTFYPLIFDVIIDRFLFTSPLFTHVLLYLTHFLPLLIAVLLAYLAVLDWWRCILFSLLLSGKLLISPSILIESLSGKSSLDCSSLFFITWNVFCHSLLACSVSVEKSASSLIRALLYVTSCFPFAAFKIHSLCLKFAILIIMCLGEILFGFLSIEILCASLG